MSGGGAGPLGGGLALIGYRATGKSTVGRIVAERLGRAFFDTDHHIMREMGVSIHFLFKLRGEEAFRLYEENAIRHLTSSHPGAVLATGGGSVVREVNRRALRGFGIVAWLRAPAEILVERLRLDPAADLRPALTSAGLLDEVASVLEAREPLYRECADLIVDASALDPEAVAEEILRGLPGAGQVDPR